VRIGMMVDTYTPYISGVTHHVSLTADALRAAGHQVYVFTLGDDPPGPREAYVVRSPGVPLSDTGFYLGTRYTRAARRVLQSMDVLHVHHPFLSGRLALRYGRPTGIPIVFTNHTRYELMAQAYMPPVLDDVSEVILNTYLPRFCREVDRILVPAASVREVMRRAGITQDILVIPNGVDLGPFRTAEAIPREALGFGPKDVVLVYVGRLGYEKNLATLVRAFAGVHAAYPDVALLLVGEGAERDNLEDRARLLGLAERIHFTGRVDYREVPGYMAAGDLFVTTSLSEVHPLSVIEALATGLPVVGIRAPGVQDIVVDGEIGCLSPNELAAYTAVLTRCMADVEGRRRMSAAARVAAEAYAIERTSGLLAELYETMRLSPPRRRRPAWHVTWRRLVDSFT
jgi:1,2-diacylglycerol 3-alpha-glucosyltransferase